MDDLIEALTILRRYDNPYSPTHCEHDVLTIMIEPDIVSEPHKARLKELGVEPSDHNTFMSFRFGSA